MIILCYIRIRMYTDTHLVLVWTKSRNKTNCAVFEITEYTNIQINTLYEMLQESLIRCRLTTKPTPPKIKQKKSNYYYIRMGS